MTQIAAADLEAARRVLQEAAVRQQVPRPRLGEWWRDLLTRVAELVAGIFDLSSSTVRGLLTVVSWGLIVVAGAVLLGWVASVLWRRRQTATEEPSDRVITEAVEDPDAAVHWEQRLRRALDLGDVSVALRAQWQVLVSRLGPTTHRGDATGHWTTRALIRRLGATSQKAEFALRRLERWTYGERPPGIDDLRGLQKEFEILLPSSVEREP